MEREREEHRSDSSSEDRQTPRANDSKPERLKFASNSDIHRKRIYTRRGQQTSSGSDSEGQEESRNILHRQRKHGHLEIDSEEKEESTIREERLHRNGARQTRTANGDDQFEEVHRTSRSLNREGTISHPDKSSSGNKYAVHEKDITIQHILNHADDKQNTNSDSSGDELEKTRASLEGQGRGKRQGTPQSKSDKRQRSRSRSTESDQSASRHRERNRKSRHHHHHHHRHRHHHKRNVTPSEGRGVKQRNRDRSSS